MQCTIAGVHARRLWSARPGELFVPADPRFERCVCAVPFDFAIELQPHEYRAEIGRLWDNQPTDGSNLMRVVVVACDVAPGAPGFHYTGEATQLPAALTISVVLQVEPQAFSLAA